MAAKWFNSLDTNSNKGDSSSEEDDSEPEEPEPKFLWAAQHNNVELIKDLYSQNSNLVKFADSDGYTALHRAAYSGSKVFLTYIYLCLIFQHLNKQYFVTNYVDK